MPIWEYKPGGRNTYRPFYRIHFQKGNTFSLASNMSPEANKKRADGLMKSWIALARKREGVEIVSGKQLLKKEVRKRVRLRTTIAKEAREIQEIARTNATAVMEKLAEIVASSHNESAVIAASQVLLDRAYGKSAQTHINANVDAHGKNTDVSQKELDKRIESALKRVEAITGGAPKAPKSEERPDNVREFDRDPDSSSLH